MTERAKRLGTTKHERRFFDCPGAWIGCLPGLITSNPNYGHIVVDPTKAVYATRFLSRFYTLTGSKIYDAGCGGNPGLTIEFETKGKEWMPMPVQP